MQTINDVHAQFAGFFPEVELRPLIYLLSKKLSEGHVCIDPMALLDSSELPEPLDQVVGDVAQLLGDSQLVSTACGPKRPMVWHRERLYLQRYFHYETVILERIKDFLDSERERFPAMKQALEMQRELIRRLFGADENAGSRPDFDWQMMAALLALVNQFTIITGGPGTGKTTTVAKILTILFAVNPAAKVALAAPTGKAAFRMAESLKNTHIELTEAVKEQFGRLEPVTLHRLLKAHGTSSKFRHHAGNPLRYDLVIVDEASMVDVTLFAKLLDAVGSNTQLILLGDKNQLASVEAGSVLGDLCHTQSTMNVVTSEKARFIQQFLVEAEPSIPHHLVVEACPNPLAEHVVELQKSHRFSDEKGIGLLSKAIINNDQPVLQAFLLENIDDAITIDKGYDAEKFHAFAEGYRAYIQEPDTALALKKLNDLRVLCAIREGDQGVYAVNRRIEGYLQEKKWLQPQNEFYENRPVMVLQNNPGLRLFNGDIGIVRKDAEGSPKVWFEDASGALRAFIPGHIGAVETVFATTVHKSQGSEFDRVLVLLPNQPQLPIMTRELVYTAITRGKSHVLLQCTDEVLMAAAAAVWNALRV